MLKVDGNRFVDAQGRTRLLRGVNLGGSSKVPATPDGATWRREGFFAHRDVSFVGRPFPLEEADEHLRRLKRWGLTTLRFLTTWEAVAHAGPESVDDDYLTYLEAVVRHAGRLGFEVFIDFHQDVWSRFSGGDGAPGWTLEAVGFVVEHLHETGAAFVHSQHDGPLPRMVWPSNHGKLASATMFALFFAGDEVAPKLRVDGEPIQRYLQRTFLHAVEAVARRLREVDCVFGYDVLNEPSSGYLDWGDLTDPDGPVTMGPLISPLDSMALACGWSKPVQWWTHGLLGRRVVDNRIQNPRRLRAWRDGVECLWRAHGVWEPGPDGAPRLLRPDHFNGVAFNDVYRRFLREAHRVVRRAAPKAIFFLESGPQEPGPKWSPEDGDNVAYAPHWYDGIVLFMKRYLGFIGLEYSTNQPVFGSWRIRKSYARQLRDFILESKAKQGGLPVLVGEIGVAFDLDHKRAFETGDFHAQSKAMDRSLTAVEDAGVSATLWNYTADNSNALGDGWNEEDLSLFSRDQQRDAADLDSGGRALDAVVRPYPSALAGTLVRYGFARKARRFELVFDADPAVSAPTEVFLPTLQYPKGFEVEAGSARWEHDAAAQVLKVFGSGRVTVVVTPKR